MLLSSNLSQGRHGRQLAKTTLATFKTEPPEHQNRKILKPVSREDTLSMEQKRGLSSSEAAALQKQFGPNEIIEVGHATLLEILARQVKANLVIFLLLISVFFAFLVGKNTTGFTILAIIFVVVLLGFYQEYKSEKTIRALKQMITPVSMAIRDGKEIELNHSEIVPGDILILRTGEKIPADCLILEEKDLKINESMLTGESREIKKIASPKAQKLSDANMVFMGTFVVGGKCLAGVLHTGMNTKFGKIAYMISASEKELPLRDKINKISLYIAVVGLIISAITGALVLFQGGDFSNEALISVAILVIAISVSAFPEGFPLVLTTTLSVGAHKMAKKNAIVNRLSIIETLGETTVICSDKTGTITKGEMTVKELFTAGKLYTISGTGFESAGNFYHGKKKISIKDKSPIHRLLRCGVLCNDSDIHKESDKQSFEIRGSPTEAALLVLGAKAGLMKNDIEGTLEEEFPFSSERKMMSVLWKSERTYHTYSKGALEIMLKRCSYIESERGPVKLTKQKRTEVEKANKSMTLNAYRTIALAYSKKSKSAKNAEKDLILIGIVGIDDPPREEVKESINICRKAGIKVKLITGDNPETALSVAKEIALDNGKVLLGEQLDNLTDDELCRTINEVVIFARVRPEHKLRIVKALKTNGEIVTMTGDGVNDAPALKEAHVGVAMGKNGTDVCRSVADLTLKDDHFSTIVDAIHEGRTILKNIRKFVSYQLACNVAELSLLFFGVLFAIEMDWPIPLLVAIHILFMNLVTSDLPAITLGLTSSSPDIMEEKPSRNASIVSKDMLKTIITAGLVMFLLTITAFYISYNVKGNSQEYSRTALLLALILIEVAAAFSFRSFRHKTINFWVLSNKNLVYASIASIALTFAIIHTPLNQFFETVPLGLNDWLIAGSLAIGLVVVFDVLKEINKRCHLLNL